MPDSRNPYGKLGFSYTNARDQSLRANSDTGESGNHEDSALSALLAQMRNYEGQGVDPRIQSGGGWAQVGGDEYHNADGSWNGYNIPDQNQIQYDENLGYITPTSNLTSHTGNLDRWLPAIAAVAFGGPTVGAALGEAGVEGALAGAEAGPSDAYWNMTADSGQLASDAIPGAPPGGGGPMPDIEFPQIPGLPPGSAADGLPPMSSSPFGSPGLNPGDLIRAGSSLAGNVLGNRSTSQNSPQQMQAQDRAWQEAMWGKMLGAQRPNQHNAWGDRTWKQDPKTGQWEQTDTLNPAEQQRLDSFRGIAQDRMNRAGKVDLSAYDKPMDWASLGFGNIANAAGVGQHVPAAPMPMQQKPMQQPIQASVAPMPDPSGMASSGGGTPPMSDQPDVQQLGGGNSLGRVGPQIMALAQKLRGVQNV